MKKLVVVAFLFCSFVDGGYIVTAPNRFIPDREETVCASLHNLKTQGDVRLSFTLSTYVPYRRWSVPSDRDGKQSNANKTLQVVSALLRPSTNDMKTCVKLKAASTELENIHQLMVKVEGRQSSLRNPLNDVYEFKDSKIVSIRRYTHNTIIFIQTDKPVYQPGQTVKFRVLTLDSTLRPLTSNIDEVLMETPSTTRISQWSDVPTRLGLGDFHLKLSEEPELGTWRIRVKVGEQKSDATFRVDEYVLPKFEVTIKPPAFVTIDTPQVSVGVCARYTYGEPVRGNAKLVSCLQKSPNWGHFMMPQYPRVSTPADKPLCHLSSIQLSGNDDCGSVTLTRQQLGYHTMESFAYGSRLEFSGYVIEDGTGVLLNASEAETRFFEHDIELMMIGRSSFKPGIPYNGKVEVIHPDQTPAVGKNISISINDFNGGEKYVKHYLTNDKGEVLFTLPPVVENKTFFNIIAEGVNYPLNKWGGGRPTTSKRLTAWYSPSGRYIQFSPQQDKLQCGTEAMLELVYTVDQTEDVTLAVTVVGPGDITDLTHERVSLRAMSRVGLAPSSSWDKSELKTRFWHPYLPVYDVGGSSGDNQTTTDPLVKETTTVKSQQVNIAQYYGSLKLAVPVTAQMSPMANVLVYYVAADDEVISDEISIDVEPCTANKVAMQFDKERGKPGDDVMMSLRASPSSLCAYGAVDQSVYLEGGDNQLSQKTLTRLVNRYQLSEYSGAYNKNNYCQNKMKASRNPRSRRSIYERHRRFYSQHEDSKQAFDSAGVVVMTDLNLETRPCSSEIYGRQRMMVAIPMSRGVGGVENRLFSEDVSLPSLTVREYFPETWLWDLVTTDLSGNAEVGSRLPHTITEWSGNAMCIHQDDGLGVATGVKVVTYQSFFVSATLPYSAIRGETIPIALTVFNYLNECLPVQLKLKSSREYRVDGESTVNMCVCGKSSETRDFPVVLEKIGVVNLTVTATVEDNSFRICNSSADVASSLVGVRDAIIKPLIVEPEGAPREYTISEFICKESDAMEMRRLEFPLPPSDMLVPDSVRSSISVIGDVMGSALTNVDNLLRMPYGCGEQNMVGFSPNVFVLQYLQATNRDNEEVQEKATTYMKSGYQREMRYRHSDGSYSAFGPGSNPGSIWLTAFVVKCFAQASPFIYVDPLLQEKSITYFRSKQLTNGCFPQVGSVHSKYMQGGLGKRSGGKTALTAYILISMLEAGVNRTDRSVVKAIECLRFQPLGDNYTLSLVTYAFSLYNPSDSMTRLLYQMLLDHSLSDSVTKYWKVSSDEQEAEDATWWYRPKSVDVEATSYALLAVLRMTSADNDKVIAGLPIVRWLSQQRNAYGGFGSTQDTVIGLQALAQFASLIYSDALDLDIAIRDSVSQLTAFNVKDENSLVQQSVEMSRTDVVNVEVMGSGCFLLQGNVKYNVFANLLKTSSFSVTVEDFSSDVLANPCKQRKLHICTRYEGREGKTNMAVVQVRMVSGWVADPLSLKRLMKKSRLGLRRYDVEKNNDVQFYFDQLRRIQKCFDIEIQRVMEAKNVKPAVVSVYDYYQKELSIDVQYELLPKPCIKPVSRTGTKQDLPDVDQDTYDNSISQQRQPSPARPPWARGVLEPVPVLVSDWCPKCFNKTDEFQANSVCLFKNAYKVYWKAAKPTTPMALMADLRPKKKIKFKDILVGYELPVGCSCSTFDLAEKRDKLLILSQTLEEVENGQTLDMVGAQVVPLSRELERAVNKITKIC